MQVRVAIIVTMVTMQPFAFCLICTWAVVQTDRNNSLNYNIDSLITRPPSCHVAGSLLIVEQNNFTDTIRKETRSHCNPNKKESVSFIFDFPSQCIYVMLYCSARVTNKILNKANIAIFFKFLLLAARDRGGGCASQLNLTH